MKNSNLFYKKGCARALMHLVIIPIILFSILLYTEKQYSLLVPFGYLLLISIAQFIRLKKTQSLELRIYSNAFFDFLKALSILFTIIIVMTIIGLGVGQ
jgi:hypothetical protein